MIRPYKPEDRPMMLQLMREFYHSPAVLHPVPDAYLERTCSELSQDSPYVKGFILQQDAQPAGYGLLALNYSCEAGGLVVWLEELYIRESCRGSGLGSEFLQYVEDAYPQAARFRLEVEEDNQGALRLYRRKGYVPLPYLQMIKE